MNLTMHIFQKTPPRSCLSLLLATSLLLCSAIADAGPLYRWVDDEGKVHYGDSIPPQYVQKGYRVVSEQGITVYTIKPASEIPPPIEEKEEKGPPPLSNYERGLLATYTNEDELLQAKARKLADIDAIITLTRENRQLLENQFRQYTREAGDFERRGQQVPEQLRQDIVTIQNKMADIDKTIERYKAQKEEEAQRFDNDLDHYRALKSREE